jgi:alginate O-acetyltransferase complex protein AlgI
MSLVGVEMLFFLPLALLAYWLAPRRAGAQNLVLLALSMLFYAAFSKLWLLWLLASSLIDFVIARALAQRPRPGLLALSLVNGLGMLAFCKYAPVISPSFQLLLPLGLSFYTLQRLGYVLDVYWGRMPAEESLLRFLCFTTFFPQITAGPIGRASELLPQYAAARELTPRRLADGGLWFLGGYLLKAFAAARLGTALVDPVWAAPADFDRFSHCLALFGFGLQVFCDFAGYSLMALAVATWFGIDLPQNFRLPFLSRSLPEFWRRWHITFNQWLFEYVFVPANTGSGWLRGRTATCLLLVFLLSGLWHGSTWPFVLWGLLQGLGMVVHFRFDQALKARTRRDRRWIGRRKHGLYALAAWFLTQVFFFATLLPFRAGSTATMAAYASGLWSPGGHRNVALEGLRSSTIDALSLGIAFALPIGWHLLGIAPLDRLAACFFRLPAPVRGFAYGLGIVFLLLFVPVGASTFVYRNF